MEKIKIHGKNFSVLIKSEEINKAIKRLASEIKSDYTEGMPLFIGVLNGAFMFASDLLREINMNCRVSFIKLSSYSGGSTTGEVTELLGLNEEIAGKDVIVLEDIVETGTTLEKLIERLKAKQPKSLKVATMLFKPEAFKKKVHIDYIGFKIPNNFIIGYGLDYGELGRNYKDLYSMEN